MPIVIFVFCASTVSCLHALKVPCHAFPVITCPLVCYEAFSACKRSAKSQTLKYTLYTHKLFVCVLRLSSG